MTSMRCPLLLFGLLAALSGPSVADEGAGEAFVVAAQTVSARALDGALPPVPLVEWLGALARHPSEVVWEVNDCGEQTGSPADAGRDFPACVEAVVPVVPGTMAHVSIMVGTFGRGVLGEPALFQLYVERGGEFHELEKLSALQTIAGADPK